MWAPLWNKYKTLPAQSQASFVSCLDESFVSCHPWWDEQWAGIPVCCILPSIILSLRIGLIRFVSWLKVSEVILNEWCPYERRSVRLQKMWNVFIRSNLDDCMWTTKLFGNLFGKATAYNPNVGASGLLARSNVPSNTPSNKCSITIRQLFKRLSYG